MTPDLNYSVPLGMSDNMLEALEKPFDSGDIKQDQIRSDGFVPRSVEWHKITKRLDEVFHGGWSWEILENKTVGNQIIVHGSLIVYLQHIMPDGKCLVQEIRKDGIGSSDVRSNQHGMALDFASDVKAASTDALKRAAVLLRVAIQLYQKNTVNLSEGDVISEPDDPAQDFQIHQIIKFFEEQFRIDRAEWTQAVGVDDVKHLTQSLVVSILSGEHPFVRSVLESTGAMEGAVTVGLIASDA